MVPKPFSRVFIRFTLPITVPRKLAPDAFEDLRLDIEKQIKELYAETDSWWRSPEVLKRYFS